MFLTLRLCSSIGSNPVSMLSVILVDSLLLVLVMKIKSFSLAGSLVGFGSGW